MAGPLDGIRAVEFGHLVQGPLCGQMLCDMGAEIVKVESPLQPDRARALHVAPDDDRMPYFHAANRGKRCISLDIGTPRGLAIALRLVARADALLANLRPGALDGLGLGYEACAALNPALVYAEATAFGPEGPQSDRAGVDLLAQAAGGLISKTGGPDQPTPAGATIADSMASQVMCSGILAALLERARSGRGQRVQTSLYGSQIWAQAAELSYQLLGDREYPRLAGGQPNLTNWSLYGVYRTADGHLALAGVPAELWDGFVDAIERPDLAADPRFVTYDDRREHVEELRAVVVPIFASRPSAEWDRRLRAAGQRYHIVRSYAEVQADEQARVNGYLVDTDHPDFGPLRNVGTPIRMERTPLTPAVRAPQHGEHTELVLEELGIGWDEIEGLRADGVI